jgi:hypothetical protein
MLVIVLVVDQDGILAIESEGDSPVATDGHRPATLEPALQRMHSQAGKIHVPR